MPAFRRTTRAVLFPVRPGREPAIRSALDAAGGRLQELFPRAKTLHFARLVLVPPAHVGGATSLLVETTFDGEMTAHLEEIWALAGPELSRVLAACEGFSDTVALSDLERAVQEQRSLSTGFDGPHPGLTVARIREHARLRDAVSGVLSRDRGLLVTRSPDEILAHVQKELGATLPVVPASEEAEHREEPTAPSDEGWVLALVSLVALLVASVLHDLGELLARLWHEPPGLSAAPAPREHAAPPSSPARPVQRAFTHRVALKPGAFRRRALRRALAWVARHRAASGALVRPLAQAHSVRWVLGVDGELLFTAQHDGSIRAWLAEFGPSTRVLAWLVWSSTRACPGPVLPSREQLATWAEAHELVPAVVYSAYPMLTVGDLAENAELSALLSGESGPPRGERFLELV